MELLNGKALSIIKKEELKDKISKLNNKLTLVIISFLNDDASKLYIKQKIKMGEYLNCNVIVKECNNSNTDSIVNYIKELNNDNNINGIIVQLPIPEYLDKDKILNSIDPDKDIDGLCDINRNKLINNQKCIIPCTARSVIEILEYYNIDLNNKNIVVVGRSNLVGKPIATILSNRGCNVNVVHSQTIDSKNICNKADILIVAIGKAKYINKEYIKDNAIVVDVGTHNINGILCGDVDFNNVKDICSYITPVPGGVGPMTVYEVFNNLYETIK